MNNTHELYEYLSNEYEAVLFNIGTVIDSLKDEAKKQENEKNILRNLFLDCKDSQSAIKIDNLEKENKNLNKEIRNLKQEIVGLNSSIEAYGKSNDYLANENETLKKEITRLKQVIDTLNRNVSLYKTRLEYYCAENVNLAKKIETMRQKHGQLLKSNCVLRDKIVILESGNKA